MFVPLDARPCWKFGLVVPSGALAEAMSVGDGGREESAAATGKMEIKIKRTGFNEKLQTRGPNAACKSFFAGLVRALSACL